MEFTTSVLDTCSGKYTVQRRNQDECQHSRYRQTTDYGNRHRTPHLRTLSATDSHRDHTQNGSSRCHQYRAETALTGCHHRVDDRHTPLSTERDVVDEHNTVLHHNTDQHDTSQQTHYTQRTARKEQRHQDSTKCKRQREHDNERISQRLELCRHYDEYKNDNQDTQCSQVAERILLVFIRTGNLNRDFSRNIHLINKLVTCCHYVTQRSTGDNGGYGHDTFTVFTLNGRRRKTFDYLSDIFYTHGLAFGIINKDVLDAFQTCTIFGCIAHFDIILIPVFTIFGSNGTIDTITQVVTGCSQVQSVHRQLLTVEINLILGLVVTTADVHLGHPFHGQQLTFQTGCYAISHRHIVSVYLKVGTCLSRHTCITTSQNNLCLAELRITFQVLTHLVADCFQ